MDHLLWDTVPMLSTQPWGIRSYRALLPLLLSQSFIYCGQTRDALLHKHFTTREEAIKCHSYSYVHTIVVHVVMLVCSNACKTEINGVGQRECKLANYQLANSLSTKLGCIIWDYSQLATFYFDTNAQHITYSYIYVTINLVCNGGYIRTREELQSALGCGFTESRQGLTGCDVKSVHSYKFC